MSKFVDPFADPAAQEDSTFVDPFADSSNDSPSNGAGLAETQPKQVSSADKFAAEILAAESKIENKDEPGWLGNSSRALSSGAVSGTGFGVRGIGEMMREGGQAIASSLNTAFDTDIFRSENPVKGVAQWIEQYGDEIKQGMSSSARKAMEDSTPTGDIIKGTGKWGEDPSMEGYIYQTLNVFGQLAPVLLTAYATRGQSLKGQMGTTAGVSAAMGGGGGASEEGDRIRKLKPEQLENVPLYVGLVNQGMSHEQAVEDTAIASEIGAFRWGAPVSAITGLGLGYVMSKPGQLLLSKLVGKSMPARIAGGSVAVGSEESVQEVLEGISTKFGQGQATAEDRDLTEGSFGNAVLGFLGGTGGGALGGLANPNIGEDESLDNLPVDRAEKPIDQQDAPSPETMDDSEVIPTQEDPKTIIAQLNAVMDGRKPAMLVTPGSQIPDDIPEGLASFDLGPKIGQFVYPRSNPELLERAKADVAATGMVSGEVLGYGTKGKPVDSDTVLTARDADGQVIQDAGDDGSQEAMDAAEKVAGEDGSVEERPVLDAHSEREAAQPNDLDQQKEELRQQFRDGEINNAQFAKAIADLMGGQVQDDPRYDTPDQEQEEPNIDLEPTDDEIASMGQSETDQQYDQQDDDDYTENLNERWSAKEDSDGYPIWFIDDGDFVESKGSMTEGVNGGFVAWINDGQESIGEFDSLEDAAQAVEESLNNEPVSQKADRRQTGKSVEDDNRDGDVRRQDSIRRKEVDEMSFDERGKALLTDNLIDMQNRRAYDESEKKTFQAFIDGDSLKYINDEMGHDSGDFILNEIGLALKKAFGDDAYRLSGDEFAVQGAMKPQMEKKLKSILEDLSKIDLFVELPDGKTITLKGIGFSYGISNTLKDADSAMLKQKDERTEQGLRADPEKRGGRPPNATEGTAEGEPDSGVNELSSEEEVEGISDDDFESMLDDELDADSKSDEAQNNDSKDSDKIGDTPLTDKEVDDAANQAATSLENDKQEPTQNQKDAENYKLGDTIDLHGVKVRVENPRDSYRFKVDQNAIREMVDSRRSTPDNSDYADYNKVFDLLEKSLSLLEQNATVPDAFSALKEAHALSKNIPDIQELMDKFMLPEDENSPMPYWVNKMRAHYGKILGTVGADGDHVDIFLGRNAANPEKTVFIIDQINPETGEFDEHKVMMGYKSLLTARLGYLANYDKNWKGMGGITAMSMEDFVEWTKGDTKSPVSDIDNKPDKKAENKANIAHNKRLQDLTDAMNSADDPIDELAILDGISKKTPNYDDLHKAIEKIFNEKKRERASLESKDSDITNDAISGTSADSDIAMPKDSAELGKQLFDGRRAFGKWTIDLQNMSGGRHEAWVEGPEFNKLLMVPKQADGESFADFLNDRIAPDFFGLINSKEAASPDSKSSIKKGDIVEFIGNPSDVKYSGFAAPDADINRGVEITILHIAGKDHVSLNIEYKSGAYDLANVSLKDLRIKPKQDEASKPKSNPKKKAKKPDLIDRLENFFQADRIVDSYGGRDRVVAFERPENGEASWSVRVIEVDSNGKDIGKERAHSTQPSNMALGKWEKTNPVPDNRVKWTEESAYSHIKSLGKKRNTRQKAMAKTYSDMSADGLREMAGDIGLPTNKENGKVIPKAEIVNNLLDWFENKPLEDQKTKDRIEARRKADLSVRASLSGAVEENQELLDVTREASSMADIKPFLLDFIAGWVESAGTAAENNNDNNVLLAIDEMVGDGLAGLNDERFNDEFLQGQYEMLEAANKRNDKKNKKKKPAGRDTLATAGAKELASRLDSIDDSDQAEEFARGWAHAVDGGTMSNLEGRDSQQTRLGYQDATKWMKDEKRSTKGKKQGSTGTSLRRSMDGLKNVVGGIEAELNKIFKLTVRSEIFNIDEIVEKEATPGVSRYFDEIARKIIPFKEWHGSRLGGTRRRWGQSNIEVISEEYADAPELTIEAASAYLEIVEEISKVFSNAKNVKEATENYDRIFFLPSDYEPSWSSDPSTDARLRLNSVFRGAQTYRSDASLSSSYSKGRIRDEGKPYNPSEKRKQPLVRPRLDHIDRHGLIDKRKNKNITNTQLKETFGFTDITVGEGVTSKEEQDHFNYAYDSFMSLSETLGISPKQMSLGGWLHFSIGALGHGKFAAHFSPNHPHPDGGTVPVINLTNKNGNGALAHEWMHALDERIAINSGNGGKDLKGSKLSERINDVVNNLKYRPPTFDEAKTKIKRFIGPNSSSYFKHIDNEAGRNRSAPKIDHAIFYISGAHRGGHPQDMQSTSFMKEAVELDDKNRKDPYWSNNKEIFARAGEAYVFDEMNKSNSGDNYLVSSWVEDGVVGKPKYRGKPYPESDERIYFNSLFNDLFKSITWESNGPTVSDEWVSDKKYDYKAFEKKLLDWVVEYDIELNRERNEASKNSKIGWKGGTELARNLYKMIDNGTAPRNNKDLRSYVTHFDGKKADDTRLKEAQEDFEAAMVQRASYLIDQAEKSVNDLNVDRASTAFSRLRDDLVINGLLSLYNNQPLLNIQTTTSSNNQAYSTPAPLAYLVSRLMGINHNTSPRDGVYEPTAGNGMLLIDSPPSGNVVNEIDPRRADALQAIGGKGIRVYRDDALSIKGPSDMEFVIANPPFGAMKSPIVFDGYKFGKIDQAIAAKALESMKDDGSAALIIGAGKIEGDISIGDRVFFNWLYANYNVSEHFEVSGDMYSRQGASWPVRVIVIHGRSKSDNVSPKKGAIKRVNNYEELYDKYQQIQYGDVVPNIIESPRKTDGNGNTSVDTEQKPSKSIQGSASQSSSDANKSNSRTGSNENDRGLSGRGTDSNGDREGGVGSGNSESGSNQSGNSGSNQQGRDNSVGGADDADRNSSDGVSDEDFESMFDDEIESAGKPAEEITKPNERKAQLVPDHGWMVPMANASEQEYAELIDGYGWMVPVSAFEKSEPEKTAKQHLKDAAKSASKANSDAWSGLDELFGSKGKLSSGLSFDEETYKKAKPFFKKAMQEAIQAGKSLKEALRAVIQQAIKSYGAAVKPYLMQFNKDITQEIKNGDIDGKGRPVEKASGNKSLQTKYKSFSKSSGIDVMTPANQSESVSLAMKEVISKYGDVDNFLMDELKYESKSELYQALMGHQVDGVAMAIHQLKNDKALIIGDQTGVGKGRQAASIIRWAKINGHVPVFVTAKPGLYSAMHEDMAEIGSGDMVPILTNPGSEAAIIVKGEDGEVSRLFKNKKAQLDTDIDHMISTGSLPEGRDMVYTTYSQLSPLGSGKVNKRQAMIDSLADKGAVFILDESHLAAGSSGVGKFMRSTLEKSQKAVYLSATYAKRPDSMPIYFLTDLSLAADSMDELTAAIEAGGVPLMEIVSAHLTRSGQFIRRELSFKGISIPTWIDDSEKQNKIDENISNEVTERLRAIVRADRLFHSEGVAHIKDNAESIGRSVLDNVSNFADAGVNHSSFTSVVHNAIAQMTVAIKADRTAAMAIEALKRGEKPVIALESTLGSFLDDYVSMNKVKKGDIIEDFDFRTVLARSLRRSRRVTMVDKEGFKHPAEIPIHFLPDNVRFAYEQAEELINDFSVDLPASPIDRIRQKIEEAGYSVAEITGRQDRVDYTKEGTVYISNSNEKKQRVVSVSDFNNGDLDVLIINKSGAEGISLHSAEKFGDKDKNGISKPRIMIVAQASLDVNVFMQILGRINRNGQQVLPIYRIFSTNLPAEKRPTAVVSGKLKKLNANTSSNETSATSVDAVDMMNKYGDETVARFLVENPEFRETIKVKFDLEADPIQVTDVARSATGQLALLEVSMQRDFYERTESEYTAYIDFLNDAGRNELVAKDLDFQARLITSRILHSGTDESNPFTSSAIAGLYSVKLLGFPPKPDDVKKAIKKSIQDIDLDDTLKLSSRYSDYMDSIIDPLIKSFNQNVISKLDDDIKQAYEALSEKEKTSSQNASLYLSEPQTKQANAYNHLHSLRMVKIQRMSDSIFALKNKFVIGSKINLLAQSVGGKDTEGIIVDIVHKPSGSVAGNPFAPSRFTIKAMVNGPQKMVSLPMSSMDRAVRSTSGKSPANIDSIFTFNGVSEDRSREARWIVTGNLLRSYSELERSGDIIRFTKIEGGIEPGILLPQDFNPEKDIKLDEKLSSPEKAIQFLIEKAGEHEVKTFGVSTRDKTLKVLPSDNLGGLTIIVKGSVKNGGKWWQSQKFTGIIGKDFAGNSTQKTVTVRPDKALDVMKFIFKESPLFTLPSMASYTEGFTDRNGGNQNSPANFFSRSNARSENKQFDRKETIQPVERPVSGVKAVDVQAVVDKTTANWKDAPEVKVVQSVSDLPQSIQDDIHEANDGMESPEAVEGVFDVRRTKVWIIADEISSADVAQKVLIHESVGHYGIRRIFGDDIKSILRQVYFSQKAAINEIAERYGLDLSKDEDRLIAAEEVLAHMAEKGKKQTLLSKLISAIREWLRKRGFNMELSDGDIQRIIAQASRAVRTGKKADVGGITAMSRKRSETSVHDLYTEVNDLEKRVDTAFESGNYILAERLDARLAGTKEYIESVNSDTVEYNEPDDESAYSYDEGLAKTYKEVFVENSKTQGFRSKKEAVSNMRENIADSFIGRSKEDYLKAAKLPYDDVISIAKDAYEYKVKLNERRNPLKARFSRKQDEDENLDPHLKSLLSKMGKDEKPSLFQRAKELFKSIIANRKVLSDKAIQATFDQFHGLKLAEKEMDLAYDSSAYVAARMSTSIDSQLMVAMTKGPLRWVGNRATFSQNQKGLLDILQPVESKLKLWEAYMVAKRSKRLMEEGKEKLITQEEIDAGMALLDKHPEFETVAAEWAKFNKSMLDFAQDAGLINPDSRKIWEHDDYIPFYRIFDEEKSKAPKGKRGMSHQSSGIKELKGGESQLNDILENMIMNTSHLLEAAMKNHAMQMTVTNLKDSGLIRPAPYKFTLELIPMSQFKNVLEEQGVDPDQFPAEMLEGMRKMYAMKIPSDRNVIRVMENGKAEFYYVDDPLLLRSLTSIDQAAWGAWMDVFRAPKRWLTNMVTADPAFQAANFIRDTLGAFVLSRDNVTPLISGFKGLNKALTKDNEYWEMLASGGGFHSGFVNSHDPGSSARTIKAEMRHKDFQKTIIDSPLKRWDRWQEFGSAVENANRIAVYDGALKAGKTKLAAAYEAKDFMDFSMRGDYAIVNFLAQTVPFFNARLQGMYRLGRGIQENPTAFATRGALIAVASIALWIANKDDDRYKELKEWDKDTYWHFWVGNEHFRFPKPFEVGFVFGTLPERIFDGMYQDEDPAGKKIMERILWNMKEVFNLGALPQTFAPMVEQYFNEDTFREMPIIGPRLEGLPEEQQYTQWTHKTSIAIGQELGVSPARIDHLLKGYFGTIGDYALSASDVLVKNIWDFPDDAEMRLEDFPVAKRFYRGSDPQSTRYATEYWDAMKKMDKIYKGVMDYQKYGNSDKAKALYEEEKAALKAYPLLKSARSALGKLRQRTEYIHRSEKYTPPEKRDELNKIAEKKNEIYKKAVTRAKKLMKDQ